MKKIFLYLPLLLAFSFVSCGDDDDDDATVSVQDLDFATGGYGDVTYNTATVFGYIYSKIPSKAFSFGIVYGTSNTLDLETGKRVAAQSVDEKGRYAVSLTDLTPNTTYYYAAYIQKGGVARVGDVKSFATANDKVTTGDASNIDFWSVTLSASTTLFAADWVVADYGFEVSTTSDFASVTKYRASNISGRKYSMDIENLAFNTTYYYRAYVSKNKGATRSFTTKGLTEGEYVDLGLKSGTLWATKNVGAESPTFYGLYFQWGDTRGYSNSGHSDKIFNYSDCKYYDGKNWTKYTAYDGKPELLLEDDAAYVNWGENWRMPSHEQFLELINSEYVDRKWATVNYVKGWLVVSKENGNSIFFPTAGYCWNTGFYDGGKLGGYWSRTLYLSFANDPSQAHLLCFHFNNDKFSTNYYPRHYGFPVRPVRR